MKLGTSVVAIAACFSCLTSIPSAVAQIVPDTTLPQNSIVLPPINQTLVIEGGTQVGGNLFHSFTDFSVPTGWEAFFNNSLTVENILTRITGTNPSNIDGLIRANGTANLFLLNPNGMVFGPNAQLDIGGSFLATSAQSLVFGDGSVYSATEPDAPPLLSINVPVGLQFGTTPPGDIVYQPPLPDAESPAFEVASGKNLALVGGNVTLEGRQVLARGGRVEIGGLVEPGTVALNGDGSLSYPDGIARGNVLITDGTEVNVRSNGGGSIAVKAANVEISGGSTLRAGLNREVGMAVRPAGDIEIRATGDVLLSDAGTQEINSFISNAILGNSTGQAGNVYIDARSLSVEDGFQIYTGIQPNAAGTAGSIYMNIQEAARFNGSRDFFSGAYSRIENNGNGDSGSVYLSAGSLSLTNGAVIQATLIGKGTVGSVNINVRNAVLLDGVAPGRFTDFESGGLYSRVERETSEGTAGGINLTAGSLTVSNGAIITASTVGRGNGGQIYLNVRDSIALFGDGPFDTKLGFARTSGIYSSVRRSGIGEGGQIRIATQLLSLTDGGTINADTRGQGNGGSIEINAERVYIAGVDIDGQSSIILSMSEPTANGRGGQITVNADRVQLVDGGIINARTRSPANGGDVTINANVFEATQGGQVVTIAYGAGQAGQIAVNAARISLLGSNPNYIDIPINTERIGPVSPNSGLFGSTESGSTGAGGTLSLSAQNVTLSNGGEVSVSSTGMGTAGNVIIDAESIQLDRGLLSAETNAGNGNISIRTEDLQLRRNSSITTNARGLQPGGNIAIDTATLTALENSDISANSQQSEGGRITINTQGILGTEFREFPTPKSDLTATSALGTQFNGIVQINLEGVDATSGLIELPEALVDVDRLVDRRCVPGNSPRSEFAMTGRGGIPPSPRDALSNTLGWVDPNSAVQPQEMTDNSIPELVEAQGWILNETGHVELVTEVPNEAIDSFHSRLPNCGIGGENL